MRRSVCVRNSRPDGPNAMSEFQTRLVVIGALVIVAVFAYNKWQEYRAERATDETFRSRHPDVLIGAKTATGLQPGGDEEPRTEPGLVTRHPQVAARSPDQQGQEPLPH